MGINNYSILGILYAAINRNLKEGLCTVVKVNWKVMYIAFSNFSNNYRIYVQSTYMCICLKKYKKYIEVINLREVGMISFVLLIFPNDLSIIPLVLMNITMLIILKI